MENNLYNFKQTKSFADNLPVGNDYSLKELIADDQNEFNVSQLIEGYINDIKNLLESDDINQLIIDVLDYEQTLEQLKRDWNFNEEIELPELSTFFQRLSPLFLRSLIMNDHESGVDLQAFLRGLQVEHRKDIQFVGDLWAEWHRTSLPGHVRPV